MAKCQDLLQFIIVNNLSIDGKKYIDIKDVRSIVHCNFPRQVQINHYGCDNESESSHLASVKDINTRWV